jgi:hypothetical protein
MITIRQAEEFLRNLHLQLKSTNISFSQDKIKKIIQFTRLYSNKLDITHDFKHITLVHNTGLLLLKKVKSANFSKEEKQYLIDLVVLSSLLHDCCAKTYPATNKELHHIKCAELAYKKLIILNFDSDTAKAIKMLIKCHSTTGFKVYYPKIGRSGKYSKKIVRLASKVLYDADKLQTIGILGTIRGLMNKSISQNITYKDYLIHEEKQIKKLKLKESLDFIEFFGHLEKNNESNLLKLLYTTSAHLESL